MWAILRATRRAVLSRRLTSVTLVIFGLGIFLSQYLVLFEFYREAHVIREMGVATITLWGLLVVIVMSGALVTHELEDRTAVLLLSKPVDRTRFLLGKFMGVMTAVIVGIFTLSLFLFLTLWVNSAFGELAKYDTFNKLGPDKTTLGEWGFLFAKVLWPKLAFVMQGAVLSFLQVAILAAISVSLAAFSPLIVSVSGTTLFYILGNITRYFVVNAKAGGGDVVAVVAQGLAYLLPNFAYLNPGVTLSEGEFLSVSYLLWVALYSTIYVAIVLGIASLFFERREIR